MNPHGATANPRPRLLVSTAEAAAALGLSHRTVRSLVYAGTLRSIKVGARRLIAVQDLESFVRSLREPQSQ
jgi:excisionase family DNA binding protein